MTYDETATLMVDTVFVGRVKVACLHFADYITGEATTTPAHNTRFRWAQATMAAPDAAATNISPVVVNDPLVQANGAAITDADLQSATETAINKVL